MFFLLELVLISFDREAIGGIGLRPQEDVYRRSAEIGYWVGEPFWSKVIATGALREVTEDALMRESEQKSEALLVF